MFNPLNNYGSYLIRGSESSLGSYVLSVRDKDQVRHYKIKVSESGEFFITARSTFKTLQNLVVHYQRDADGLCINLRKPCVISPTDVSGEPVDEWQIDRGGIRLVRKLMSGQFTEMWEGIRNATTPVAVMTLIPNQNMTIEDFLQLANLMKKLHHPNLVQLHNLCSKEEPVLIITELMKHGSFLEYLHGEGKSLKHPQLIHMASQVASGMTYLEEQNNIIHRDLAARNILVGEGILCKVANFELAQVMDRNFYKVQKQGKIAIKWTAPEATLLNTFSIKSDVWSFGIVLYEIITYGKPPYLGMTDEDVKQETQQGYRMPQPDGCPSKLYDIMLNCWRVKPANRPKFETLQRQLAELKVATRLSDIANSFTV
jgi:fyn-related kinase